MINMYEVSETNKMIESENLDVRTITLGISLLDCVDSDLDELNRKIYEKITTVAKDLVSTGKDIEKEFGIPIVNKRISITPVSLVGAAACKTPEDYVTIARTLDRAAEKVGVHFIGGYSALVSKGMTPSEENLIRSIPQALAETERICSSSEGFSMNLMWYGFLIMTYFFARSQGLLIMLMACSSRRTAVHCKSSEGSDMLPIDIGFFRILRKLGLNIDANISLIVAFIIACLHYKIFSFNLSFWMQSLCIALSIFLLTFSYHLYFIYFPGDKSVVGFIFPFSSFHVKLNLDFIAFFNIETCTVVIH